jgi:hypothetical protein
MGTTPLLCQMSRPPTVRLWVAPVNGNLATLPPAGPALKEVVEKVLTTSILKANRTALRAVKRQGIVSP